MKRLALVILLVILGNACTCKPQPRTVPPHQHIPGNHPDQHTIQRVA